MPGTALLRRTAVIIPIGRLGACHACETRLVSVCSAIEEHDLTRLAALAVATKIPAGQSFIGEGEPASDFFNITSGTVKLFKLLADGRRQITGFADAGLFLGLAAGKHYGFSAEAIDDVTACRFSRTRLRTFMQDAPQMEERLLQAASSELVTAQEQMLLLGRKTARERVASFLSMRADIVASCATATDRVALPMTRADIADYLGLTIETVSRTLTRLRVDGLIEVHADHSLTIVQRDRLNSIASGAG